MKSYYAYIRVSTARQGTKGVSLQEQRSAIEIHATKHGYEISEWFEERVTAAKTGRAVFSQMMERLRKGEAAGLIIHKIDRSARNLKDWAHLGELIDAGVDVQIASDNFDLTSRGGRLSADIQAVVAADYIRNLREESRKGMYGRLKQGIYPLKAPVGYLDNGGGQLKTHDPALAHLVRKAFELYASGKYSLRALDEEMYHRGLRSRAGGRLGKNGLSRMLNNPFYKGTLELSTTGQRFPGKHEPLVSSKLYRRVQDRLNGKHRPMKTRHAYAFSKLIQCELCGYSLVAETQKGIEYYRCHTSSCEMKTLRADKLIEEIDRVLKGAALKLWVVEGLKIAFEELGEASVRDSEARLAGWQAQLSKAKHRMSRLTDLFLDGDIDRGTYELKKAALEKQVQRVEEEVGEERAGIGQSDKDIVQYLEHAECLIQHYKSAPASTRRDLLEIVTSNRTASPGKIDLTINPAWSMIFDAETVPQCGVYRDRLRTFATEMKWRIRYENGELDCSANDNEVPNVPEVLRGSAACSD